MREPGSEPMPLDPAAKNLLDLLAAAGRPKVWQIGPVEGRQSLRQLAQVADAKDVPIGRVEDGEWPGPAGALPYRSYTPVEAAGEPLPALVYFHGGCVVIGGRDYHDGLCRLLAHGG